MRGAERYVIAALVAALLVACGGRDDDEALRAALAGDGLENQRIIERSEDGNRWVVEATRGNERCTVQAARRDGQITRAMQCMPDEPIEAAEHDCARGNAARCAEAAARLRAQGTIDWPRATRAAMRACEGSEPRECLYVGMAHELGGRGVPVDREAAARMYERACEAGSTSACQRR